MYLFNLAYNRMCIVLLCIVSLYLFSDSSIRWNSYSYSCAANIVCWLQATCSRQSSQQCSSQIFPVWTSATQPLHNRMLSIKVCIPVEYNDDNIDIYCILTKQLLLRSLTVFHHIVHVIVLTDQSYCVSFKSGPKTGPIKETSCSQS